jgi:hypothetical protein
MIGRVEPFLELGVGSGGAATVGPAISTSKQVGRGAMIETPHDEPGFFRIELPDWTNNQPTSASVGGITASVAAVGMDVRAVQCACVDPVEVVG